MLCPVIKTFFYYWQLPDGTVSHRFKSVDSALRSVKRKGFTDYKIIRYIIAEYDDVLYYLNDAI